MLKGRNIPLQRRQNYEMYSLERMAECFKVRIFMSGKKESYIQIHDTENTRME